jgi:hypothetical protein
MPPEKEKAPHDGGSTRGDNTMPNITDNSCKSNIPPTVIKQLEREMNGIEFGGISLIINFRNGHPSYRIEKVISVMAEV